ncbi:FadR/GntR family transcriptional regulator [[Mycobacterium] wendilense]|uniref:FadR/GntR family transcriptional regulator n=1 Tax=[Mycobacterium] wendilense TaxID=3064284 RepID=UPI0037C93D41
MDAGPAAGRRAARLARLLEAEIIRRNWPLGESLGSEPQLQEQYGVSRSVLREAVRLIEHHQVARMRRGPGGGLIVTTPDAAPATRAMVIYLEYVGTTVDELFAARLLLEPLACGLAAERVDEPEIAALRAALAATADQPERGDLHLALAEAAGNPVLALFVEILTRLTARYARGTGPPTADARRGLRADHAAIVDAVTAGDVTRARTLTEQHVRAVTEWLRDQPRTAGRRIAESPPVRGKRAELVAAAIHEDIAADGWRTGTVFGGEGDLLQRYGVSRSVLREAVRLLEYHTVARMRRGPGGGLIVTEPQPEAAVDTIALYLDYRRPSRADLGLVREAIEVDNVAAVVARRAEPEVAAFLARRHEVPAEGVAAGDAHAAGWTDLEFHAELAELAGNRILEIFLRIIVELFGRHWTPTMRPMPGPDDAAEMYRAHGRIVEAIREGDDSMARHRCRRHLEALSTWWV